MKKRRPPAKDLLHQVAKEEAKRNNRRFSGRWAQPALDVKFVDPSRPHRHSSVRLERLERKTRWANMMTGPHKDNGK